ncbi:MAG: caspase family protein [Candidatus Schekmanbacteria bacterium]|nr:caspase family protein [Candidatus Schekmanbacteria bacterium]
MRSASPGKLPINVSVTQTDFPAYNKTLAFNIQEKGAVEVAVQGEKPAASSYSQTAARYNMPPTIVIASHHNGEKLLKPEMTLVANIGDDQEVSRVRVELNGRLLTDDNFRGIQVEGNANPRQQRLSRQLKLDGGENQITVIAYDNENQPSQESITVTYQKDKGEIWAVLIGIGAYQQVKPLNYTINDVQAMRDYLVNDFGVPTDHVTVLTDKDATLSKIKKALGTDLMRKAGAEDQVIIFFAGHGAPEQDAESSDGDGLEKYILPYDADPNDFYSTALPMKEISDIFRRIKAERLVFLADACFAGASGGKVFRDSISDKFWERVSSGRGRVILSASSAKEVSQERDNLKHGVFTYYLLEGLKQDGNGEIDTEELYSYVFKKVSETTGRQQNPIKKGEVEGQIVLGRTK